MVWWRIVSSGDDWVVTPEKLGFPGGSRFVQWWVGPLLSRERSGLFGELDCHIRIIFALLAKARIWDEYKHLK
jgi:hypothetical protein